MVEKLKWLSSIKKSITLVQDYKHGWVSLATFHKERTYYVSVLQVVSLHVMCIVYITSWNWKILSWLGWDVRTVIGPFVSVTYRERFLEMELWKVANRATTLHKFPEINGKSCICITQNANRSPCVYHQACIYIYIHNYHIESYLGFWIKLTTYIYGTINSTY